MGFLDSCIQVFDTALRTMLPPQKRTSSRPSPACSVDEVCLTDKEAKHVSGLMRVNHSGEVCAQALYQGQAFTARSSAIKAHMLKAANEEVDHLAWCEERLAQLKSHPSYLNLFWYTASFTLGAVTGLIGDRVSLGFVVETERQVGEHLQKHLQSLPLQDHKSRTIIQQMHIDEMCHAEQALESGAMELPGIIKGMMQLVSKSMTISSYYM